MNMLKKSTYCKNKKKTPSTTKKNQKNGQQQAVLFFDGATRNVRCLLFRRKFATSFMLFS